MAVATQTNQGKIGAEFTGPRTKTFKDPYANSTLPPDMIARIKTGNMGGPGVAFFGHMTAAALYTGAVQKGDHKGAEEALQVILGFGNERKETLGLIATAFGEYGAQEERGLVFARLYALTGESRYKEFAATAMKECRASDNAEGAERVQDALNLVDMQKKKS
ncbi:hypothetical protein HY990_06970 [Candidatus Micrarchaeota archaeon]|nr:hypothetical protein [Candidatus Micrarchaeota archaeon]